MTFVDRSDKSPRRLHASWRVSSFVGIAASLAIVGTAIGAWGAYGSGNGSASIATLAAPILTGTPGSGSAKLSWTATPGPGGSGTATYYVRRDGSDAAGTCPTSAAPAPGTSCVDSGLSTGTYSYTVTAVWHSWTAASEPVSVTVTVGSLDHFGVTAARTNPTAGQPDTLTITALDVANHVLTDYTGSHCLTFSGAGKSPNGTPPAYPAAGPCSATDSYVAFTNGIATPAITLFGAQSATMHVADALGHGNGAGLSLTIGPAAPASFSIPTPATQTAGVAFAVSMTSSDAYGNAAVSYTGAHCFTFSGPANSPNGTQPVYPGPGATCAAGQSAVSFAGGAAGGVSITLFNPSTTTVLTATEAGTGAHGSTGAFTVVAGAVTRFAVSITGSPTAGTPFNATISTLDAYGTAVSYSGTHCLAFSGPLVAPNGTSGPVYPARGTCGVGLSAITFTTGSATAPITLYNAASTTLTATEGTITGTSGAFVVGSAGIASFSMTAATATPAAGAADNLTLRALDTYGNIATGYAGAHTLTFSGATAITNSPFTPNVTNAAGAQTNFGTGTSITFTAGVAVVTGSSNGTLRLFRAVATTVTVSDGTYNNGAGLGLTVHAVAVSVAAGGEHTCAVLSYGGIECWGRNNYGQLGNNSTTNSPTPVAVGGITTAVSVTAGQYHTCALLADGTARCWGYNNNGQLGNNSVTASSVPVTVSGLAGASAISSGFAHSCAVIAAGAMRCWGDNAYGQLGNNSTADSHVPVAVQSAAAATQIVTGRYHTCATTSAGVQCWGRNNYYQLGDGSTTTRLVPVTIAGITASSIVAGWDNTCAVLTNRTIDCWGRNNNGQLGDGTTTTRQTPTPVTGIATGAAVSSGRYHTCAVLTSGIADCWGYNNSGQIGDNSTTTRTTATPAGTLATVTQIATGGNTGTVEHTVALLTDGTVYCWGENASGQLGNGGTVDSHVPALASLQ